MRVKNPSCIRYFQIHRDGNLYIEFSYRKLKDVPHETLGDTLRFEVGGRSIYGRFVRETKGGVILKDWSI